MKPNSSAVPGTRKTLRTWKQGCRTQEATIHRILMRTNNSNYTRKHSVIPRCFLSKRSLLECLKLITSQSASVREQDSKDINNWRVLPDRKGGSGGVEKGRRFNCQSSATALQKKTITDIKDCCKLHGSRSVIGIEVVLRTHKSRLSLERGERRGKKTNPISHSSQTLLLSSSHKKKRILFLFQINTDALRKKELQSPERQRQNFSLKVPFTAED